jgi:hypothetical protein
LTTCSIISWCSASSGLWMQSPRILPFRHISLDCQRAAGGGGGVVTCDSWPRPSAEAQAVLVRASLVVETPSREGRLCRAPRAAPRDSSAGQAHDKRVETHAKEKPA